ncbi:helix-turn-helix domain-containing protein [Mucilaginibacter sp.]|uniref:helix-turn-helix domain-containing protein n=1 Tax=Mucilaginibacter sp. TaxID=1882438 RepID=UPI0025D42FF8|nr:helix-turn-helix domain-containing protein [Mucilaginibacter sp.]
MVKLTSLKPHPALFPFVNEYLLAEFNTGREILTHPWRASCQFCLVFFLKDKSLTLRNNKTGYYVAGSHQIGVVGNSTRFNGLMTFKGDYSCFMIQFQPNGFHRLFGHPPEYFINQIISADDLFAHGTAALINHLQNVATFKNMAGATDNFLMKYLTKKNLQINGLTRVADILYKCPEIKTIEKLASQAGMGLRNLERQFLAQIGVPPKLFCRLIRFNKAMNLKQRNPQKQWGEIAFQSGYYDQVHFNKEFREFTDSSPTVFFNETPPTEVLKTAFVV